MTLKIYSERERASYTRHHRKLSVTSSCSDLSFSKAVLEIIGSVNSSDIGPPPNKRGTKGSVAEEQISNAIDCIKWALFLSFDKHAPLYRGRCYI